MRNKMNTITCKNRVFAHEVSAIIFANKRHESSKLFLFTRNENGRVTP